MVKDLTSEGDALVDNWHQARRLADQAEARAQSARKDLTESTKRLADWLLPADAAPGEKIAVWNDDSLYQATVDEYGNATVTIRLRGKHCRFGV